jgi:two-component system, OmpR family, phosphate regulon sensor histidine kinase PhoR
MLWWIAAVAAGLLLVAWIIRRQWIHPWLELEHLLRQIERGEQPATFLVSGNRHAWRIGAALEELLLRQQKLDRQLSEDSAEMNSVFGALNDAFVVLDPAQRVQFHNPAFAQLFPERPVVSGTPLLEIVRDADVAKTIRAAFDERQAQTSEVGRGQKIFALAAVPIIDHGNELNGAVVIFHDISELKQTDQIRRDFVANVSHELRTPLSIFRGNLETLLEEENLSHDESRHIFSTMKRHSDRLNRLVEDLLNLARLEAKETRLQVEPIDLAGFFQHLANDWTKRLAQKNLRIDLQLQPGLPPLLADEFRLEQVMHNLLDNAVNYSPSGGMITIKAIARDEQIVLSVSDEGAGIPSQDLPRIFERFYRADKSRSRELGSTGLGLSIVKHIAQLHGGEVAAESAIGKGTTIHVSLPANSSGGL